MKKIVTIGLGYIGLPTSALIAKKKKKVLGVDINKSVVETINRGEIHIVEPDLDKTVKLAVQSGFLRASEKVEEGDVYLIVVPTPFKGDHEPDISYVESATNSLIPFIKEGDLYIIESTSPIGTTKKMQELIYAKRPELKNKIFMAYCPERVLPGNVMHELVYNDRVIGGIDKKSTNAAINFYKQFVKGKLHSTNARTAEMCKLVENSSRDVQIAFANELSIICDKAEINVWELIKLANKHPRVNILQPGCGVGGHCIAVDPYFITSSFPIESKIIGKAREINNYKSFWCVEKIKNETLKFELKHNKKPVIGILGLSFKPNIDDLRESPALFIAKTFKNFYKAKVLFNEPNIKEHSELDLTSLNLIKEESDILVILVKHDEYLNLELDNKIIVDFCGIKNEIN